MPQYLKNCSIVTLGKPKNDWTQAKVGQWVSHNKGTLRSKVGDDTTHLVTTEEHWKDQGAMIQEALARKAQGQKIFIVSWDWLEDSLAGGKRKETRYDWLKLNSQAIAQEKNIDGAEVRRDKAADGPRTISGLVAQTFYKETEKYADPKEQKLIEKRQAAEAQARKEREEEEAREIERVQQSKKIQAKLFGKGAKHARNTTLSLDHHIYVDHSGFTHDVMITKVDTKHNRNERCALTIYESNAEPCTYAFNCQYAGTGVQSKNDLIVSIGSNFNTVWRMFRKVFKEKTRVAWEDRAQFHAFSEQQEKIARGQPIPEPHVQGREDWERLLMPVDFKDAPFQYHPPTYGPQGVFPTSDNTEDLIRDIPGYVDGGLVMNLEYTMSGANGGGPQTPKPSTSASVGHSTSADHHRASMFGQGDSMSKMSDGVQYAQDTLLQADAGSIVPDEALIYPFTQAGNADFDHNDLFAVSTIDGAGQVGYQTPFTTMDAPGKISNDCINVSAQESAGDQSLLGAQDLGGFSEPDGLGTETVNYGVANDSWDPENFQESYCHDMIEGSHGFPADLNLENDLSNFGTITQDPDPYANTGTNDMVNTAEMQGLHATQIADQVRGDVLDRIMNDLFREPASRGDNKIDEDSARPDGLRAEELSSTAETGLDSTVLGKRKGSPGLSESTNKRAANGVATDGAFMDAFGMLRGEAYTLDPEMSQDALHVPHLEAGAGGDTPRALEGDAQWRAKESHAVDDLAVVEANEAI